MQREITVQQLEAIRNVAIESKQDLATCDTPQMRRQIVRSAYGYWSIWLAIFKDDEDMVKRILDDSSDGICK